MKFHPTELEGAYLIELEPHLDERGFFARAFGKREFSEHGLDIDLVQCNISFNRQSGTLRGMHLQVPPFAEKKVVRCISGAVFNVIIDLRPSSPTYKKWAGFNLSAENKFALYIPQGFANGFLTLEEDSELFYLMGEYYEPAAGRGVRWNDPTFLIDWPMPADHINERDRLYPDYSRDRFPELD